MLTSDEIGIIDISSLSEEQLKYFEESHKKWIESIHNIPIQFYDERYYEEDEVSTSKFSNEDE